MKGKWKSMREREGEKGCGDGAVLLFADHWTFPFLGSCQSCPAEKMADEMSAER